jgi:hypothetical protein
LLQEPALFQNTARKRDIQMLRKKVHFIRHAALSKEIQWWKDSGAVEEERRKINIYNLYLMYNKV